MKNKLWSKIQKEKKDADKLSKHYSSKENKYFFGYRDGLDRAQFLIEQEHSNKKKTRKKSSQLDYVSL